MDEDQKDLKTVRAHTLTNGCISPEKYELDDTYRPGKTFHDVHTMAEVARLLESDEGKKIEVDGIFMAANPETQEHGAVRIKNRAQFLEKWKLNARKTNAKRVLESFNGGGYQTGANLVGNDYTPLLGGPFNKQLYLHDYLRMQALAFFASNHDPLAHALLDITVNFTLGRGYRLDSKNKEALAVWRAFEKVNKMDQLMRHIAKGLARDGEVMPWFLPGGQVYQLWQDTEKQIPNPAVIPRVKLIDPSTCWEVITYPEDIDRVVAFQLVYPTQYNLYTAKAGGSTLPSLKFIFQQVPAEQVEHYRVNRAANEKRGRSDLYPAFGYLKRLRDSVEYSVVAMQKASAWAIDTEITGSPQDVQNYLADQQTQKSLAPAGSEFIHSPMIKRQYLSNSHSSASGGSVSAFEWCLSMACMAVGIPVSYVGAHLNGGQNKASALVGTEPVTKKMEARQQDYEWILRSFWDRVMEWAGIEGAECEITFPELISQDRSAKIKDLITAQEVDAIDHEYMSTSIAQELGYTSYDYGATQAKIEKEKTEQAKKDTAGILISPLTQKPAAPAAPSGDEPAPPKSSAVTKDDKAAFKAQQAKR